LCLIPAVYSSAWYSQLFPYNSGSFSEATVNYNSRSWHLLDFSYVGYNLGQTPLQTAIPCNIQNITGTGDITQELQDKINTVGLAGGGIVKIPAGTYTITQSSTGHPIGINYNNVSVEGAGSGYTIINVPNTHVYDDASNTFEGTFTFEKSAWAWNKAWVDGGTDLSHVTNAIAEGATYITGLTNLANVNVDSWIVIQQYFWTAFITNNSAGTWPTADREYTFTYLRKVISKDASGITIDAPIPYPLNPANNIIYIKSSGTTKGMLENVGVSGMTIQFADNNNGIAANGRAGMPAGCAVYFEGVVNGWVKDVHIINFPRYGIHPDYSARITIEDCFISKTQDYGGGGAGYGFYVNCSQNILIKRCLGQEARHNFILSRALANYVVMTQCTSLAAMESEDTHFGFSHAILKDKYYQGNGNALNGYNRWTTSGNAYESLGTGVVWNFYGDGYPGPWHGAELNLSPSSDGSAIEVGVAGNYTVNDGAGYANAGTYSAGTTIGNNAGLQVGPATWRQNVLYEGVGFQTGLQPDSLYEEQLKNRVGSISDWTNICSEAATFTPVPTMTPILTPGYLVFDSERPAWGIGLGSAAATPANTLTPGNNPNDAGQNKTINGAEAFRLSTTSGDWGIVCNFGGPQINTSTIAKFDGWVYITNTNYNFRLQLQNNTNDLGSSVVVNNTYADGGAWNVNSWNHFQVLTAAFGYSGDFNGVGLRTGTLTANKNAWFDDFYFILNSVASSTNTPTATFTNTKTNTNTWTKTATPTNTIFQTPTCTATATAKFGACDKVLLAYYYNSGSSSYNSDNIPFDKLTHICHAFVIPNADGSLNIVAGFIEPQLLTKAHNAGIKVLISVGGGGTYGVCAAMAGNATTRNNFENIIVSFIQNYGYDGIDIDWEGMTNSTDKANYTSLITELRTKFNSSQPAGTSWLITAAVPMTNYWGQWIDYPAIVNSIDFFNIMTYDMHGGWGDHAGHNAPLYANPSDPDAMSVVMGIDYTVVTRGVPASKLVMGVPFYGHDYKTIESLFGSCGGTCGYTNVVSLNYNEVATTYLNNGWTYNWDTVSHVPYLTKDSGTGVIVYDDPQSITEKVNYAITTRNLKGVMMWEISADYMPLLGQPLMDAMYNAFVNACPSGFTATPTISPTSLPNTATSTRTMTATNTPINTATYTFTAGPSFTSTNTFTITSTATQTNTYTITSTVTQTNTQTITMTNTPYAGTPTQTSTPQPTSTSVNTMTKTPTVTNTSVVIITPTYTNTPQAEPTTQAFKINDLLAYPNPYNPVAGNLLVDFVLTKNIIKLQYKIFTVAGRLIRTDQVAINLAAGKQTVAFSKGIFETLSQGVYYYVISVTSDSGETTKSKIDKVILLR
ncbi:MAG: glycosyl hydrolase family 18 protein, partial [bacterium]